MKTLYLLCGLAFSGKSTLAKAIVNYLNCASISLDENILLFKNEYTIQDWLETQLHSTFNHL